MVFNFILLPEAQDEYDSSLLWYASRSIAAAENFIDCVEEALDILCHNPYRGRNIYRDFYEILLEGFPFSIIYRIETVNKEIVVTSIFHHKRNPLKKFEK